MMQAVFMVVDAQSVHGDRYFFLLCHILLMIAIDNIARLWYNIIGVI
jgi:hypothetical protein